MNTKKNSTKLIITVVICFILCIAASFTVIQTTDKNKSDISISVLDSGIVNSSSDSIYGIITDADLDAEYPYIEVEWFNDTSTEYTAGEEFYIYKTENDKLVDCRKNPENYAWNDIAYIFSANSSFKMKYSVKYIDLDKDETYLLETEIFPSDDYTEKITLWLEFRTGELTDETTPINNTGSVYFEY